MDMDKHIISQFDDELRNLHNMIMEMAQLCETQLHTLSSYLRQESELHTLQEICEMDERVNRYHIDINQECVRLIAKRAPVATDLRYINASDRLTTDLERIGDECCKIARFLCRDSVDKQSRLWREIRPTVRLAKNMLTRTVDIVARFDAESANLMLKDDDELNANYASTMRQIISYMLEDSSTITQGIDILMAAKALERIGDHCINIAGAVIFAIEGEDIRKRDDRAAFSPKY